MAIVSSYSESCGNAAFTKILHDSIEMHSTGLEVDVFELDLPVLQSINKMIRKIGDKRIKDICAELKKYDAVNIQLEAGLYGSLPHDIEKRLSLLFRANNNTSVTLHSPRLINPTANDVRKSLKKILQLQFVSGIKDLLGYRMSDLTYKMNWRIIKNAIDCNCKLIGHTKRAREQIDALFHYGSTVVHPLKMVPNDYVRNCNTFQIIRDEYNLHDKKVIGIFGYISAYKGHFDALKAIESMPHNYVLLIFGRQHPQTIATNGTVDKYLSDLIGYVKNSSQLDGRVFFMGELNDQEFMDVVSSVDACWMPYYENGQDGSGIASITLELGKRVLCSTSMAFDQLFMLEMYDNCKRFDVGNYLELASKTIASLQDGEPLAKQPSSGYNIQSQANLYLRTLGLIS